MDAWIAWFIVVIVMTLMEIITINLVTIWFVLSGIIALIISIYSHNITMEFTVFVIGGLLFLVITKPIIDKYYKPVKAETNLDRIIGKKAIVIKEISKGNNGCIKVDGKEWTAFSDTKIERGKTVKILGIKGVRVKVEEMI